LLVSKTGEIANCLGFASERVWHQSDVPGRQLNQPGYLLNHAGFELEDGEVVERLTSKRGGAGSLGHNKFIVVAEGQQPQRAWTGSTKLTPTGLFTQVNNAILIDSTELVGLYMQQWQPRKARTRTSSSWKATRRWRRLTPRTSCRSATTAAGGSAWA